MKLKLNLGKGREGKRHDVGLELYKEDIAVLTYQKWCNISLLTRRGFNSSYLHLFVSLISQFVVILVLRTCIDNSAVEVLWEETKLCVVHIPGTHILSWME